MKPSICGALACLLSVALGLAAVGAEPDKPALAKKAQEILRANCYRCHGQDGSVEGGLNYLLDFKTLALRKKVVPGDPVKSKLYRRVTSDENPMPPDSEKVRPSKEDVAVLKQWIEAGAPEAEAAPAPRQFIAEADIIKSICADLEGSDERERRFFRYFTVSHLYNIGLSEDELQTYRHGLSKLVNSLSWGRRVVVPKPIDTAKTIFRIDLRDFRWSAQVWTRIVAGYPYGVLLPDATAQAVYAATEGELPYVRADWFVYAASRPPLYHDVLQLPRTAGELEKELKADVAGNIEREQVARAAFNGSGISRHNRLIERHDSPYGAYWKSYDFASSAGRQNLFAYPFGPGEGVRDFQHDGGEIIFSLPNGLQGYLLVDARGRRLDEGPTKIVSDPRQEDRAVVNGISCMSCHSRGLIDKADQVREHVAKNPAGFPEREAALVRALYPPPDKLTALIKEDAERFKAAVEKTGGRVSSTDPIVALAARFEVEMDLTQAAAEAGLHRAEFGKRLGRSAGLSRSLGSLNVDGGTVQRRAFEAEFTDVVRELRLGTARTITNSVGMKLNYIPAGEFLMGSPDDDPASSSDERPRHKVRITKPFYLGIHVVTQEQYARVVGRTPSWFHAGRGGGASWPVDSVSWENAGGFCETLSLMADEKRAGRRYRLPTEAEWEYACRAGTTTRFAFGDQLAFLHANFGGRWGQPLRVGSFPPNRFGLYDMHGNVWQMCSDWYEGSYYRASPASDPQGPAASSTNVRIMRGGCFGDTPLFVRSAVRSATKLGMGQPHVSFRVVCIQD